jgi:hypothetical protein
MGCCGHNHHNNEPWESKETLPYTLACTIKSTSGLAWTPKWRKEERKEACCLVHAGRSCYLNSPLVTYIQFSVLEILSILSQYTPMRHSCEMHAREMHARKMHAHKMHIYEMQTCEMHIYEIHAYEIDAREVHIYEMHARKRHARDMRVS